MIMTHEQQYEVGRVRGMIEGCRSILDELMYGNDPVNDEEYEQLREAYDLLCKANDKL